MTTHAEDTVKAFAMLPAHPFYRLLRLLPLRAVVWAKQPDVLCYSGKYPPVARGHANSSLVFVHCTLQTERSALDSSTASVSVNGGASHHGIPLTMVNITPLFSLSKKNHFTLWAPDIPKHCTLHVSAVRKISEDELLRTIDDHAPYVHKWEETGALLKAQFADEDQVVVQHFQVSLLCPLTKTKMRVPSRGVRCRHVQCFDALAYLDVNESTLQPSWKCPVCGGQVFARDIRVDLFTLDVVGKVDNDCNAVVLECDGSWQPMSSDAKHSVIVIDDSFVEADTAHRDFPLIELSSDSDE
ncbi:E3 SUMO-protein ligase PIAS1-like [Amblyomma americanum]